MSVGKENIICRARKSWTQDWGDFQELPTQMDEEYRLYLIYSFIKKFLSSFYEKISMHIMHSLKDSKDKTMKSLFSLLWAPVNLCEATVRHAV